ncbi:hypothetical protein ASD54_22875 [Rhizobium sp. Root149]|nr:hypothetical protein ASD54_22875 [Rhizobium sp. Root149]
MQISQRKSKRRAFDEVLFDPARTQMLRDKAFKGTKEPSNSRLGRNLILSKTAEMSCKLTESHLNY